MKFLRFLRFLLSLAEMGVRAEDVQKPAHQNNEIQAPFAGLISAGSLCQGTEHLVLLFPRFVHILLYALGYWFAEKIYLLSKLLPSVGLFLNGDFSLYAAVFTREPYQYLQMMMVFVTRDSGKKQFY